MKTAITTHKQLPHSIMLVCIVLLLLTACSEPVLLELPEETAVLSATLREYRDGEPVSREFPVPGGNILYNLLIGMQIERFTKTNKQPVAEVPAIGVSYQIRLRLASGEVRTLYAYAENGKAIIEEPGSGIYQGNRSQTGKPFYDTLQDKTTFTNTTASYLYLSLLDAFGNEKYALLPEYNGAGKAVWIGYSNSKGYDDSPHTPLFWPGRYIPKDRIAERAEDVRYIAVCRSTPGKQFGVWYDKTTGKELGPARQLGTDHLEIHDLVTGRIVFTKSSKTMDLGKEIADFLRGAE